jgi:nuclear pore complex protein Nup155
MAAVPMPELLPRELQLRMRDDLFSQVFNPPQRFVLLSNAGVIELEKRRPVDVLQQLLQEERPTGAGAAAGAAGAASTRVAEFFQSYGAAEAAAMCILLASAPPGAVPAVGCESWRLE